MTSGANGAGDSVESPASASATPGGGRVRRAFRDWRNSRPFWGGLLIILGGVEMALSVKAPLRVVVHTGLQGIAGYAIPLVILLCGLLLWFSPAQRLFYAVLSVLLSLFSWITSNLGGFMIGMLLGLIGGSLAFAWSPPEQPAAAPAAPAAPPAPDGPRAPANHSPELASELLGDEAVAEDRSQA